MAINIEISLVHPKSLDVSFNNTVMILPQTEKVEVMSGVFEKEIRPSAKNTYIDKVIVKPVVVEDKDVSGFIDGQLSGEIASNATSMRDYAFRNMANIEGISLPKVKEISLYAFSNCTSLKKLKLDSMTKINSSAFSYCSALEDQLDFTNVISINTNCFYKMNQKRLFLPNLDIGSTSYGKVDGNIGYSFSECLAEEIRLPILTLEGKNVGYSNTDYPFARCPNLKRLIAPSLYMIPGYACYEDLVLEYADIGNVFNLSSYVFNNCHSLKAVILRNTDKVCALSSTYTFNNCFHLTGVVNSTYNPNGDKDCYIYVPDKLVESYKVATNWSSLASQIKGHSEIPDEYKELFNNAFEKEGV